MRLSFLFGALILFCAAPIYADSKKPPSQASLDAISARGRLLADYDRAASAASDAVQEINPKEDRVTQFVAVMDKTGWKVLFARLDKKKQNFLVAYEAVSQDSSLTKFDVKSNDPPVTVTGFPLFAVKAMATALAKFQIEEQRAYNIAALPADRGRLWVYIYPAQTSSDIWPLGGDNRYLISANGEKIIANRRMHKTIIDFPSPPTGTKIESGYHTSVLDNIPEDSDVFYVLTRRPSVPEFVVTRNFTYLINTDGSIKFHGTRQEFGRQGGIPH